MNPNFVSRIEGGIYGLLIGDALGVPYEFRKPDQIPTCAPKGYSPPPNYDRAHVGVPPGTWSDDGAQALCLMASLISQKRFDPKDFGQRLSAWYDDGYMAVDGVVFDVGVTTARAIVAIQAGVPPLKAGPSGDYDNGNGSLMRVLPLALWHKGPPEELVEDAHAQSAVTHGHPRAQACCALFSIWVRNLLVAERSAWDKAVGSLRRIYANYPKHLEELDFSIRPDDFAEGKGSGYVVDSFRSAKAAAEERTFDAAMRKSIGLGNDTDTTAAIAGGVIGVRLGLDSIPEGYRGKLRGKEIFRPVLDEFVEEVRHNPSYLAGLTT